MKTVLVSLCLLLALTTVGCNRAPKLTPAEELQAAIKNKDHAAVKALLASKPPLNQTDSDYDPPLTSAVETGDVELVQLLINEGAQADHPGVPEVGSPGNRGVPLLVAASRLDVEMVRLLLANGAEANRQTMTRRGPSSPLYETLDAADWVPVPGNAATKQAAAVKIIRLLVEHGAKPRENPQYRADEPPTHWAAHRGEIELLQWLSTQGFAVHALGVDKNTTLHEAADGGHDAVVRWLLTQMVEVDARTELENWTPLHRAAHRGHASTAKILLEEAGCNVNGGANPSMSRGGTPLHAAVFGNHMEVARILIDAGADLSLRDEKNLTPLGLARGIEKNPQAFGAGPGAPPPDLSEMISLLREHGAEE